MNFGTAGFPLLNTHHINRIRLVLSRWFDVGSYAVCACAVWIAAGGWIAGALSPVSNMIGSLTAVGIAGVLVGLTFAAWSLAGRSRTEGWLGIRHLLTYPPTWLAALLAIALWKAVAVTFTGSNVLPELSADARWLWNEQPVVPRIAAIMICGAAVAWPFVRDTFHWLARQWFGRHKGKALPVIRTETLAEIREWVRDDAEIKSPEKDKFGHNRIATRIAQRLRSGDEAPTIAVIGPLGSGKSSIRGLTKDCLYHDRSVRVVHLSLWPFDSPEAAVRGILRALVQELSRHVGALSLVGLSDDYMFAIEKSAGAYGGFARLLRGSPEPETIVNRIAEVACAAGIRLVLWVEDLERFSGGDQLDAADLPAREVERLGAVRALLYLLDKCPAVSVVIADVSLRTRFDVNKIARFVERMPQMDKVQTWRVIDAVRTACLDGYPENIIDPASSTRRAQFGDAGPSHTMLDWLDEFQDHNPAPRLAIARTLSTPRSLKAALRLTIESWETLCGEIDFDSLLVASVLRVTRPEVFTILDQHVEAFRHGLQGPFDKTNHPPHPAVGLIDDLLKTNSAREAASIKCLINFVFPKYPPNSDSADHDYIPNPQGLNVNRHADNWHRFLSQEPVPPQESDQAALRSIAEWKSRSGTDLVSRLIDPSRSQQIETFVSHFQSKELLRLTSDVADALVESSAAEWERQSHAPGITAVWRMIHIKGSADDLVYATIQDIVKRIGTHNLPLAHDILYFFASRGSRVPSLMSEEQQASIRKTLQEILVREFSGANAADHLRLAVRDGTPWIIYWIAGGLERTSEGKTSRVPIEGWQGVAEALIALAERDPAAGVPLMVPFIANTKMDHQPRLEENGEWGSSLEWKGEVDPIAVQQLFDPARLRAALLRFRIPDNAEPQISAYYEAALRWANQTH